MTYLILQILFCLIVALIFGFLLGWLFGRCTPSAKHDVSKKKTPLASDIQAAEVDNSISSYAPPPPPPSRRSEVEALVAKRINTDTYESKSDKSIADSYTPPPPVQPPAPVKADLSDDSTDININAPSHVNQTELAPSTEASQPKPKATLTPKPVAKSLKDSVKFDVYSNVDLNGVGYEIGTLEGVGPKTALAMRAIQIDTIFAFLENGHLPQQRAEIASKVSVRPKMVDSWASMSDLLRIEGVDHQSAELMHKSGILVVADLASQNAGAFIEKMKQVNTAGKRSISPTIPSEASVENWISQAAELNEVVKI